jgi:hypothetical protein
MLKNPKNKIKSISLFFCLAAQNCNICHIFYGRKLKWSRNAATLPIPRGRFSLKFGGTTEIDRHCHSEIVRHSQSEIVRRSQSEIVRQNMPFVSIGNS